MVTIKAVLLLILAAALFGAVALAFGGGALSADGAGCADTGLRTCLFMIV